jgi:hypothetical protein
VEKSNGKEKKRPKKGIRMNKMLGEFKNDF